jgi:hypothetical protein
MTHSIASSDRAIIVLIFFLIATFIEQRGAVRELPASWCTTAASWSTALARVVLELACGHDAS